MIGNVAGFLLVTAGLLLPGLGWAAGARWPAAWLAAGVLSGIAIFAGVVGFSVLGLSVTAISLGLWLGAVAAAGGVFWWRRRTAPVAAGTIGPWWLAWPALPMLAVATVRAVLHPLAGADNVFRWDHLARLIVQTGNLDYYPAHTAAGFSLYFWADGIAPMVSSLYAWTYLAAGSTAPGWTAVPVLLQVAGLCVVVHGLAQLWGGARAGWFAVALAGATMLVQFAFCLGQETGLTALGAGGMLLYLVHWRRERRASLLVPAAACAALVACAREYGAAFALVGIVWVARAGAPREKIGFAVGAGILPAIWHLRNWMLTGNPFYAQDVAGWFPLNPIFHAWMQGYVDLYGRTLHEWAGWREVGRLLLMSALPALLGFGAGAVLWRRDPGGLAGIAVGVLAVGLWYVSVPFTAGGVFYAMRVLSPLAVIGCAWGGAALARWVPGRRYLAGVMLGLGLFGTDAALRAWTIPFNPYSIPARDWPEAGYRIQLDFMRDDQAFIEEIVRAVPGKVLSDSAGLEPYFLAGHKSLVPLWSPDVAFLFDPAFTGDAAGRLRELGYSHLLLKRSQFSLDFLGRTGAWGRLNRVIRVEQENPSYILFALHQPGGQP